LTDADTPAGPRGAQRDLTHAHTHTHMAISSEHFICKPGFIRTMSAIALYIVSFLLLKPAVPYAARCCRRSSCDPINAKSDFVVVQHERQLPPITFLFTRSNFWTLTSSFFIPVRRAHRFGTKCISFSTFRRDDAQKPYPPLGAAEIGQAGFAGVGLAPISNATDRISRRVAAIC